MDLAQLVEHFAIPGVLAFNQTPTGLIYASITTPAASATIYLLGAHVAHWQPVGERPVIFLGHKSDFAPGKPIRGGVPLAFPWFATRHDGKTGPSHGFARIQPWTLAFAALTGDELHLTFTLGPTQMSRDLGFDNFRLAYKVTVGRTLTLQLTVANEASTPLVFEEAMHTYYAMADVREATITGLDGVTYLDKNDHFAPKVQHGPVIMAGMTDRVYQNTAATCVLHDAAGKRRITVEKTGSNTTVVWNPWDNGSSAFTDLEPTEWREFLCCETVNAGVNTITLAPGAVHSMQAHISVEKV
ncbi:D-hexose-6-phosphate mutarotase [Edaphobacter acidisoli]|uniref:Putative glucose-6-phosphate 1-epimerase n=1 Tax=Edaphobacter acidisoli TaxID=2040573 RepID=A0A916W777_9BACT|nr:D-hexose-6-phosphate mutarotase [Edaphobacter acidisoli]GGA71653.1 D-hexose-6-phosphate mutarotase [Edaphobacter acidisoli]